MAEVLKITSEMKSRHDAMIDEIITKQNETIKRAIERGDNKADFICYDRIPYEDYYSEVREMYEHEGYTIKPTGCLGGVWQRTEDICW